MNIYHAMTDWFNLWLAKQVMNLEKFDVLTMDDYEVLPKLDPVWTKILGASSVYTLNEKQKEGQVCYKKVIFGESGAHSMLMQSRYRVDCNNAELYKKFAREFKAKMNPAIETSTKRRITAVVRKDHGKTIMRQFQNEDEIVNALRTLDNVQVTVVDLVTLSLQEQFNLIANTDILFATHGAALTHSLFLPEDAVVVEFSPVYSWYENLVTMAGRKHLSFGTNNYFRHTIPVNIPELLSVMKKALTM
jgi:protein O-GlcNAc transferase